MTAMTPNAKTHEGLGALASRYLTSPPCRGPPRASRAWRSKCLWKTRRPVC